MRLNLLVYLADDQHVNGIQLTSTSAGPTVMVLDVQALPWQPDVDDKSNSPSESDDDRIYYEDFVVVEEEAEYLDDVIEITVVEGPGSSDESEPSSQQEPKIFPKRKSVGRSMKDAIKKRTSRSNLETPGGKIKLVARIKSSDNDDSANDPVGSDSQREPKYLKRVDSVGSRLKEVLKKKKSKSSVSSDVSETGDEDAQKKDKTDKKEAFKLSKRLNLSKVIRSGKAKRGSESDGNGKDFEVNAGSSNVSHNGGWVSNFLVIKIPFR
ncbi:uncharacterized protein LOC117303771 [Asterias rubens]|uniref:uncharacterized protein LOC117303771 n=1 Tax=Asterias rubens TaxID=7604 RepID=UPI0014555AB0|nr:uncharacterized protein LOC117303771 [Asterias rubens]